MWCYRRILKIHSKDVVRNVDIRRQLGAYETIIDMIKKRKLRLFGHISMRRMARRHYGLVRIQLSRLGLPYAEQVPMEKPYPNRGWPQRAISL